MARTLRVGMVGYRFMGRAHSNAWRQAPRFFPLKAHLEMHTLCGRDAAGVQAARAQLGWQHACTDWREIVESPLIDIVDIVTPTDSHAEIAIAALQHGKHVLCEKPMGMDVKQAQAMQAAAQKTRCVTMVCHNYRRVPAIALARRMISEGTLGRIFHYHARYAQDRLADPDFPLDWRLRKETNAGGVHADINSHLIDLGRFLVGEFQEVCGLTNIFVPERPIVESPGKEKEKLPAKGSASARKMGKVTVPDSVMVMGKMANGVLANLEATKYALGRRNRIAIEVNGSKGSIAFDFEDMNRLQYYNGDDPRDRQGFRDILVTQRDHVQPYVSHWWPPGHPIGYEHTFVHTIADFVNACIDGKPTNPSFEDGLKTQRVLEAVERSSNSGKWVKL